MELDRIIIRSFETEEWAALKSMRLRALQEHRDVFSGRYEDAVSQPDDYWIEMIGATNGRVFGLFDGEKLIGITGIWRDKNSATVAGLYMSYFDPDYRSFGLSRLMYKTRIDWARSNGITEIYVSHREGNDASKAANQKFGFQLTRIDEVEWPDGKIAKDYVYKLVL